MHDMYFDFVGCHFFSLLYYSGYLVSIKTRAETSWVYACRYTLYLYTTINRVKNKAVLHDSLWFI